MDNYIRNDVKSSLYIAKKMSVDDPLRRNLPKIDDPNTFFNENDNFLLGKYIKSPKFDKYNRIIPHTVVGPISLFDFSSELSRNISKTGSKMYNFMMGKVKDDKQKQITLVNNVEINKLYDVIDSRLKKSNVNDFMKEVPKDVSKKLKFQEECLSKKEGLLRINDNITKLICSKTKKKEEELLMNKSPVIRMKNEIKDIVTQQQRFDHLNRYEWILSLRRRRHDKSELQKISYVNIGSDFKPTWTMVNENNHKGVEFVRSPFSQLTLPDIEKLSKTKYFVNSKKHYGLDIKKLEEYSNLKLEGSKLLDEEIKMVRVMKGKKYLHKKDEEANDTERHEYYNSLNTYSKNGSTLDTSYYINTSIK